MPLMSDETKSDFDPRFDPAFQRGFDPATPIREKAPVRAPRREAPVVQQAPVQQAPVQDAPVREAPVREAPTQATPVRESPAGEAVPTRVAAATPAAPADEPVFETVQDGQDQQGEPLPESSQARNPYLVILVVVAIVLVAVGVWLFVQSGNEFNSREVRSQGDYMSLDATIHMAPFIAMLGGATAIGVLFMFASKWRKRR
jgi:hypothetical protein